MKKKQPEQEPGYLCNEKIDGTKVYYYYNPPEPESENVNIKAGKKTIAWAIVFVVVMILVDVFFKFIPPRGRLIFSLVVVIIAAIFVLVGVHKIKKANKKKAELEAKIVSDEEYDKMEEVMLEDIEKKGLTAFNLEEEEVSEAEPLILHRYSDGGKSKQGKDEHVRSTEISATVFYFSEDSLFVYEYSFSMMTPITHESTTTVFYRDIVSVLVSSGNLEIGGVSVLGYKDLQLALMGGQSLKFDFVDSEGVRNRINAMQALFRNKKKEQ